MHLISQLQRYEIPDGTNAIVVGTDFTGAHIYHVTHPGVAISYDSIGFVAIGAGQWHAASQFMFARYAKDWQFQSPLYLTYAAKKRAEVAPGVGEETDIVLITTTPRNIFMVSSPHEWVQELQAIYADAQTRHLDSDKIADEAVRAFFDRLLSPAAMGKGAGGLLQATGGSTAGDVDPEA